MKPSMIKNSEALQSNKQPDQSKIIESKIYKETEVTEEQVSDSMIYKPKFQGRSSKRNNLKSEKVSVISKNLKEKGSFLSSSSDASQDLNDDNNCLNFPYKKFKSEHRIHIQGSELPRIFFCSKI